MYNPANGNLIGEVDDLNAADVKLAIDAAYNAFQGWKSKTAKVR